MQVLGLFAIGFLAAAVANAADMDLCNEMVKKTWTTDYFTLKNNRIEQTKSSPFVQNIRRFRPIHTSKSGAIDHYEMMVNYPEIESGGSTFNSNEYTYKFFLDASAKVVAIQKIANFRGVKSGENDPIPTRIQGEEIRFKYVGNTCIPDTKFTIDSNPINRSNT